MAASSDPPISMVPTGIQAQTKPPVPDRPPLPPRTGHSPSHILNEAFSDANNIITTSENPRKRRATEILQSVQEVISQNESLEGKVARLEQEKLKFDSEVRQIEFYRNEHLRVVQVNKTLTEEKAAWLAEKEKIKDQVRSWKDIKHKIEKEAQEAKEAKEKLSILVGEAQVLRKSVRAFELKVATLGEKEKQLESLTKSYDESEKARKKTGMLLAKAEDVLLAVPDLNAYQLSQLVVNIMSVRKSMIKDDFFHSKWDKVTRFADIESPVHEKVGWHKDIEKFLHALIGTQKK